MSDKLCIRWKKTGHKRKQKQIRTPSVTVVVTDVYNIIAI